MEIRVNINFVNPVNVLMSTLYIPNIHKQILLTDLHTFSYSIVIIVKRSKQFLFGDHFVNCIIFSVD